MTMLRNAAVLGLGMGRLLKLPPINAAYPGVKPLPVPGVKPVRYAFESKPPSVFPPFSPFAPPRKWEELFAW